jgi:hypothetical protein
MTRSAYPAECRSSSAGARQTVITLIRIVHTLIWAVMASAVFYVFYSGMTRTFGLTLWLSIGLIVIETAVLLINKWRCPLTPVAMKHTSDRRENFDIYLPLWLARHNKTVFGAIFLAGLILVIVNLLGR